MASCSDCTVRACVAGAELPEECTSKLARENAREQALAYYALPGNQTIVHAASTATKAAMDGKWPRIRELIFFAHEIGAKRIGIASCKSYIPEADLLVQILRAEGFEPIDAMCRIGSITRCEAGLCDAEDERAGMTTCNPFMQADVLNEVGTDFNIIVGLCLGHDMLFTQRSHAWVTTLAVKDQSLPSPKPINVALRNELEQLQSLS